MLRRSVLVAVRRGRVGVHDDRGAVAHVVAGLWIARGVPRRARARTWNGARTSAASVLCLPALAGQWRVPSAVRLVVHDLQALRGGVQGRQRERHCSGECSQWRRPSGSGGGGGYDAWDAVVAFSTPGPARLPSRWPVSQPRLAGSCPCVAFSGCSRSWPYCGVAQPYTSDGKTAARRSSLAFFASGITVSTARLAGPVCSDASLRAVSTRGLYSSPPRSSLTCPLPSCGLQSLLLPLPSLPRRSRAAQGGEPGSASRPGSRGAPGRARGAPGTARRRCAGDCGTPCLAGARGAPCSSQRGCIAGGQSPCAGTGRYETFRFGEGAGLPAGVRPWRSQVGASCGDVRCVARLRAASARVALTGRRSRRHSRRWIRCSCRAGCRAGQRAARRAGHRRSESLPSRAGLSLPVNACCCRLRCCTAAAGSRGSGGSVRLHHTAGAAGRDSAPTVRRRSSAAGRGAGPR